MHVLHKVHRKIYIVNASKCINNNKNVNFKRRVSLILYAKLRYINNKNVNFNMWSIVNILSKIEILIKITTIIAFYLKEIKLFVSSKSIAHSARVVPIAFGS